MSAHIENSATEVSTIKKFVKLTNSRGGLGTSTFVALSRMSDEEQVWMVRVFNEIGWPTDLDFCEFMDDGKPNAVMETLITHWETLCLRGDLRDSEWLSYKNKDDMKRYSDKLEELIREKISKMNSKDADSYLRVMIISLKKEGAFLSKLASEYGLSDSEVARLSYTAV